MATIDDVEQGVCNILAGLLFPGQQYLAGNVAKCSAPWLGSPGAPSLSPQVRLGIGQPTNDEMQLDLANAISNIAVVRVAGSLRNCTFLRPRWIQTSFNVPTLVVTTASGSVAFGGIAGAGMVAGVTANKVCYAYRCSSADTPATVAEAFASMIPASVANGAVLTSAGLTAASVVADQQMFWCTGQRDALVQVMIIATASIAGGADGPLVRAALTRIVYGLEMLTRHNGCLTRFIGLPDGTQAEISGFDERDDDAPEREQVWKRVITFRLMYDAGVSETNYSVLAPVLVAETGASRLIWIGNGAPVGAIVTDGAGNILGDASGNMLGVLT